MARRYRWLRAQWPISMRTLANRLKARPFGSDVSHGFVIDRVRDDLLEGRYVERVEYTETVTDPFGVELSFERIEFRQSSFRATVFGAGLEVRDPPRSLQPLMNRLSEATDFEVVITPHIVDVLAWAAQFQGSSGLSAVVDSLHMTALQVEKGITAKVVFKGDRDVREASTLLAGKRPFSLERIQLRLPKPYFGTVILSSAAAATLNVDDPNDVLLENLRGDLVDALR
jgi:hypothetical protein